MEAQHDISIKVDLNSFEKTVQVKQEISYFNQSTDTLKSIILNDWNHAYSSKNSELAKRFSDEFVRAFHLSKKREKGGTYIKSIENNSNLSLKWNRLVDKIDVLEVFLDKKLLPNDRITLKLEYTVKLPSDKFTGYGYGKNEKFVLKDWIILPSRHLTDGFVKNSNCNTNDIDNALYNIAVDFVLPNNLMLNSDLVTSNFIEENDKRMYSLHGEKIKNFIILIDKKSQFKTYKNDFLEVECDVVSKINEVEKSIAINKIIGFIDENLGKYPYGKILISQSEYDHNPFYGINQLPSFLSPFKNDFIFEIKFLKTYLEKFLKNSLQLNHRKESWIYDGIEMRLIMKYIDENHPNVKMTGNLNKWKLLRGYRFINMDFNDQFDYFSTLITRRNTDQKISESRDKLIKFNLQMGNKYKAGLAFKYLDSYLENGIVDKSIKEFYNQNQKVMTDRKDFEFIIKKNAAKNLDWFFDTVIDTRKIVDYKFKDVVTTKDSITFRLKNKKNATVPIPIYGLKNNQIIFKKWFENIKTDSTITIKREHVDKIVINYKNEVPEFNPRNNYKKLEGFFPNNRPFKFNLLKDMEDPKYNQILYMPTVNYNLYDGIVPGIDLHNNFLVDKPVYFNFNPSYSFLSQSITGFGSVSFSQDLRNTKLYNITGVVGGSYSQYAPNYFYKKATALLSFRFRNSNFRDNRREVLSFRQVYVSRDQSSLITNSEGENYNVSNIRYHLSPKFEVTKYVGFSQDIQLSNKFGKIVSEINFRRLFENNRQLNLRLYAGTFLYNKTTTNFFNFALDRPTDYLFDYNYYGRSESKGLFSQQIIVAEGGFKSKLPIPFANQWITTLNASVNIWNWFEVYGDVGFVKNKSQKEYFAYDSGIRLNLLTDYFEIYFPVYSNLEWEVTSPKYAEKIRFIVTLDPRTLVNLVKRKWL